LAPRAEARPPAQGAGALERIQRLETRRILYEVAVGEQEERRERRGLGEGLVAGAPKESDRAPAFGEVEGGAGRARIPPAPKARALDGAHALAPRRHGVRILGGARRLNPRGPFASATMRSARTRR